RARKAKDKKAFYGEDIDVEKFSDKSEKIKNINEEQRKNIKNVGVDIENKFVSGRFIQIDGTPVYENSMQEGIEVMDIREAIKKYNLEDYFWKAVDVETDKYTALAELKNNGGYFIRAKKNTISKFPIQACLYLNTKNFSQNVHNIIIAEENSSLNIITGCTSAHNLGSGLHVGISEFFIGKNATVNFTMIHSWNENIFVRPRTGAIAEENGKFISNYINLRKTKSIQMYPVVYLNGKNATARIQNILYADNDSKMDVGGKVIFNAENTRAEVLSKVISNGGEIFSRGNLTANSKNIKGHISCQGLILADNGIIKAIPELEGKFKDIDLTHEASVGKISKDKIEYLMARGLTEEEATSLIIEGFLNVEIEGIPINLKNEIKKVMEKSKKGM
ncbi:MAG: SufB/SufD family protein, partial [Candidatus Altarchaeaceae archaeon]